MPQRFRDIISALQLWGIPRQSQKENAAPHTHPVELRPGEQLAVAAAAEQHEVRWPARPQAARAGGRQAHGRRRDVRHRARPGAVGPVQVPDAAALQQLQQKQSLAMDCRCKHCGTRAICSMYGEQTLNL